MLLSLKRKMEGIMATLKEVYELLKQKQKEGEDIGMFGESYIEMIEAERLSNTKEIHVSYVEKKKID
jgi:hypothetical protein